MRRKATAGSKPVEQKGSATSGDKVNHVTKVNHALNSWSIVRIRGETRRRLERYATIQGTSLAAAANQLLEDCIPLDPVQPATRELLEAIRRAWGPAEAEAFTLAMGILHQARARGRLEQIRQALIEVLKTTKAGPALPSPARPPGPDTV